MLYTQSHPPPHRKHLLVGEREKMQIPKYFHKNVGKDTLLR